MSDSRLTLEQLWVSLDPSERLFRSARGGMPLRYERVQRQLDRFECSFTVVEFFVEPTGVFVFVLKSGANQPTFIECSYSDEQLDYLLNTYRRELVQYPEYGTDQRWQQVASSLSQPLWPVLKGSDVVYFIPHGLLSYLPLHALRSNGDYLIDQFPIAYASSAEFLLKLSPPNVTPDGIPKVQSALVAGNPTFDLEHAQNETQWVANYFGVRAYLGKEATKIKIRSELGDKDLIHLACHGFFHGSEPLQSGLIMAGRRTLNVQDINAAKIRADLITLSACESAVTSMSVRGFKPRGLRLAFLEAGGNSVLGSLWPIPDEATTLLISDFYQRLYNGRKEKINTKAKALQQAMLAVRAQNEHPYYWAGFMLTGSWQ